MLDIKWIRENPDLFDASMKKRSSDFRAEKIIAVDDLRRNSTAQIQELQNQRNILAQDIAQLKRNKEDCEEKIIQSKKINTQLKELEEKFSEDKELDDILLNLPNILDEEIPFGQDESDNKEIYKWGNIKEFPFEAKEHFEIGENLGQLDFDRSVKMSGSRFSTFLANLAKLERALSNFMLDIAGEFDYIEVSPPNLVKDKAMIGSGQLPKFASEAFCTTNGYWLIPTSEVSLVNLVSENIIDKEELPIRFTACTPCFRSEAGAAGKDTRGIIRQHQFKKVELVSITDQESSKAEHERMTNVAQEVLKRLNLPFRKVLLCAGDIGFTANKTYDLEVWLPGQKKYREISSCSNCTDFQSRRMKARYKDKNSKKPLFVHTLNGSSLAVGRTIIAILENYQNQDGSVMMPEALVSYMNGVTKL